MYKVEGYNIYGQAIGILCIESWFPKIPGHIKNASTFNFPVKYKVVKGATIERVVEKSDPRLLKPFKDAARELEKEGVKAITGSCGFLAIFQRELAEAVNIPVFTSSLIQVPLIYRMLGKNNSVGIITAMKRTLMEKHLEAVGIKSIPLRIVGMEDQEEFYNVIIKLKKDTMDIEKIRSEVVEVASNLVKQNPDVGAVVLECTDLPPFAAEIQKATGLPVFDIVTLTNMVYHAVVQKRYTGIFP